MHGLCDDDRITETTTGWQYWACLRTARGLKVCAVSVTVSEARFICSGENINDLVEVVYYFSCANLLMIRESTANLLMIRAAQVSNDLT